MKISKFEHFGLDKVDNWIQDNIKDVNEYILKEILKTASISFIAEEINRIQSTLLCELKDSYVQQSQRYVTMGEDSYVLPDLDINDYKTAKELTSKLYSLYNRMSELKEGDFKGRPKIDNYKFGISIEDARYLLPLSTKTNLYCTMTGDKLFDLYYLITDKKYSSIFVEFKMQLDSYIPDSLLSLLPSQNNANEELVETYYIEQLNKINTENNIILLEAFDDLDLTVGLGALTSTQARTPSETLVKCEDDAKNKATNVARRVLGYGHESISEQARTTFGMMCSMVTYHQQIRHRLSENYREPLKNIIIDQNRSVTIPPTIVKSKFHNEYIELANEVKRFRMYIYEKYGLDKALFFILNADQIKLIIATNARIDTNMLAERICLNAQWEIRELSIKKLKILRKLSGILYENALPSCIYGKCKEGKLSCGRQSEMRAKFL